MATDRIEIGQGEAIVMRVDRGGAEVLTAAGLTRISWELLRAAARQDEPGLRRVYSGLLEMALRMAREIRSLDLCLVDHTGTGLRTAVEAYTVAGEYLPGRAAHFRRDEGSTQPHGLAAREREEIAGRLRALDYEVRMS